MIATLQFDLPSEVHDFEKAVHGRDALLFLQDFWDYVTDQIERVDEESEECKTWMQIDAKIHALIQKYNFSPDLVKYA